MSKKLKLQVEQVYGMPIKYGNQCQQLSLSIFDQTSEYISFQTLRRFFGFIDKNKKPTIKTLDILSKYCGYRHFEDFTNHSKKTIKDNLIEIIYSISIRKELDLNYHYACRNVAHYFYSNINKLDENISFLVSSQVSQEYLFERFPFIDHSNSEIYRRSIKLYAKSKGTIDSQIFSDSLIYLADYLKLGKSSKLPISINIKNLPNLHPFLQARVIGTYLIHFKNDKNELVSIAFEYANKQNGNLNDEFHFPFFNYMMADYFIICKMYNEAIKMIESCRTMNSNPTSWLESGYYETLELIYCIALEGSGALKKANEIFEKIDRSHFHFIFQKYFGIQYLKLKNKLKGKLGASERMELDNLYIETKFLYL
jgi:hypothetical protein